MTIAIDIQRLIPQVCRAHHALAQVLFGELGLYRGQPAVLELLWEQDGRTHTELGEALRVQPATVTKMMQRMEQAGFLERRPDPDDQRVSRVYLTPRAWEVRPAVMRIVETLAEVTMQDFTLEEQALLRRFLVQMRDNLRRVSME
ncbi:MAG: MarR family transcriptional regulator [Anaerolineae bacterium]|nr:MarR family transcriptional regulator [Anaerolineae bacterium]